MQLSRDKNGHSRVLNTATMKKFFLFLIIILFPVTLSAQFLGSGTFADPYRGGILRTSTTWSASKIYVSGMLTIGGSTTRPGTLNINPGVTVVFTAPAGGFSIMLYGQIFSVDNLFTADYDNDGNYGEAGEVHENIQFNGIGTCTFENCIFEFGRSAEGGAVEQTNGSPLFDSCIFRNNTATVNGGAFYSTQFGTAVFNNCEFVSNTAPEGGAIYAGDYAGPIFNSCRIYSNSASGGTGGGGIMMNEFSAPSFINCLIYENSTSGTLGGGGVYVGSSDPMAEGFAIIQNSVIAANTSNGLPGNDIYFAGPYAFQMANIIAWGSANSAYYDSAPVAENLVNSAFQRVYNAGGEIDISTFTGCIKLNSLNLAIDGPNFTDPANNDYSITFDSPLLDKGTNEVDPVPAATDFVGNPRIGPPDIGAYEVQYSRWSTTATTTLWSGASNWEGGVPTSTSNIVIPSDAANYPTGSPAQAFTIGSGKQMVIQPDAHVTLGELTNNGKLKLQSTQLRSASLILGSYIRGTGATEEIQLAVKGGTTGDPENRMYNWHYISTPVSTLPTNIFTGVTLDLAQFIENLPEGDLVEGWVAFDGYNYSTTEMSGPAFSSLTPGKGYDLYTEEDEIFTFGGQFNMADMPVNLAYRTGAPRLYGYNLLGNPFSSGLDWNDVINSVYFDYPAETSTSIYFTRNNEPCTYAAGVGIPSDVNGIIPPMQGFFTKTYNTGNTITLPAAARTHDNIHDRYKGPEEIIPLVRLAVSEGEMKDETVVRFDEKAKVDLDYNYDALKVFMSPSRTAIYSTGADSKYAINGQPFPGVFVEIPLAVNFVSSGSHTINSTQLQGLDNYKVELIDKTAGLNIDLRTSNSLTLTASAGVISDRFILKISNIATGIEDPVNTVKPFSIYQAGNMINIQPLADEWDGKTGSVRLLDLTGKPVSLKNNTEFWKTSVLQIPEPEVQGIYIVEIRSGMLRYTGKVVVK